MKLQQIYTIIFIEIIGNKKALGKKTLNMRPQIEIYTEE